MGFSKTLIETGEKKTSGLLRYAKQPVEKIKKKIEEHNFISCSLIEV